MPLPFSFSTQRQGSEAETPQDLTAMPASPEKVMNHAPGHISTEPILGTLGGTFTPPALEIVPRAAPNFPRQAAGIAALQPFTKAPEEVRAADGLMTEQSAASTLQPSAKAAAATGHDWAAQIDQLRNDIFGIAMNVSALSDRMDRLEQRLPAAGQSVQAGIATLRGEIETWLESHLNVAVEHCMHQIISRTNASISHPAN